MAINSTPASAPTSPKRPTAWEHLKRTQRWAAGAELPLMFRLGRAARIIAQQLEEQLDLSTPQMRILFEALEPEGVSQAALCKQYQVDPASITRTVQAMERDGLVTRRVDESDNRYMRVYATERGRSLAESLPAKIASFEQHLVKGLSDSEISTLHVLLEQLEAHATGEAT